MDDVSVVAVELKRCLEDLDIFAKTLISSLYCLLLNFGMIDHSQHRNRPFQLNSSSLPCYDGTLHLTGVVLSAASSAKGNRGKGHLMQRMSLDLHFGDILSRPHQDLPGAY